MPNLAAIMFTMFVVLNVMPAHSQFYDKDDEVRCYLWYNQNNDVYSYYIFNFNGEKGAIITIGGPLSQQPHSARHITDSRLIEDPDLPFKVMFDTSNVSLIYFQKESSSSLKYTYEFYRTSKNSWGIDSYDPKLSTQFEFSADGETLTPRGNAAEKSDGGGFTYKQVSLLELLQFIVGRKAAQQKRNKWR